MSELPSVDDFARLSSIQPGTEGMTVRNWLTGQSFADQYAYGMRVTQQILDGFIGGGA